MNTQFGFRSWRFIAHFRRPNGAQTESEIINQDQFLIEPTGDLNLAPNGQASWALWALWARRAAAANGRQASGPAAKPLERPRLKLDGPRAPLNVRRCTGPALFSSWALWRPPEGATRRAHRRRLIESSDGPLVRPDESLSSIKLRAASLASSKANDI